jgi:ribosome-binding factor A
MNLLAIIAISAGLAQAQMSSRRTQKAAAAIREVVSMAIIADLRDPRIEGVTVTFVEVSPDMRHATVHVSIMGSEKEQQLCLHGLQNSAGFLQSKISDRIDTRYTPRLRFELDMGVKKSLTISQLLNELLPGETASPAANEDNENGDESPPPSDDQTDDAPAH